jgi:hypothetical protein
MDVNGSPEFGLTWESLDMPAGPPLCRLRPWARRTGGKGCSGWPTPAANDEGHALRHQAGNESHVARQPVELGDDHGAANELRLRQGRRELRPTIEGIRSLGSLDLDMLADELDPLSLGEAGDRLALRVEAKAGLALLLGRDAKI